MKAPVDSRDTSKHCNFHETHSHATESCMSLKYFLERLVHQGQINQYIPRQITNWTPSNNMGSNTSTSNTGNKEKNIVNMVIGGNQSPQASPSRKEVLSISHREQANKGIMFMDADFEGVNLKHTEPLVVYVDIKNNMVNKFLIYNGSSINILLTHCWERLKLEGHQLEECPREAPLYGFDHNDVPMVGIVHLPILIGGAPNHVVCFLKLYVINTPSSYNIILGKSTLIKLQFITSISHLKIKKTHCGGCGRNQR